VLTAAADDNCCCCIASLDNRDIAQTHAAVKTEDSCCFCINIDTHKSPRNTTARHACCWEYIKHSAALIDMYNPHTDNTLLEFDNTKTVSEDLPYKHWNRPTDVNRCWASNVTGCRISRGQSACTMQ